MTDHLRLRIALFNVEMSDKEKKWILSKLAKLFEDAGGKPRNEGDISFGLLICGGVPSSDLEDGYFETIIKEEAVEGNYYVSWEDMDGMRWFQLYPEEYRTVIPDNLPNPTLYRLSSDTGENGNSD